MTTKQRTTVLLAIIVFLMAGPVVSSDGPLSRPFEISVEFKLDPRLSGPTYGGERWISPRIYAGASAQDTVEARAHGADADGNLVRISPEWIPSNPEMVTVSPGRGEAVKITVKRAGESKLRVSLQGVSKELDVKAQKRNGEIHLEIVQLAANTAADVVATAPASLSKTTERPAPEVGGRLKSQKEKISYVLGANLGTGIRKQSMDVDHALVVQGLQDALADREMLLTPHEVAVIMTVLQKELRKKQVTLAAEKIVADKELAEKNKKAGEAFLTENKSREGIITLESGLQYKILKAGDGKKPAADDTVICNYRGKLIDGTEFDSSYKRNEPATVPLNRVIKGWNEALQLMPVGSKWQLFIPPALAYGERGANNGIGPNATLVFEVELVSIQDKSGASAANAQATPPRSK